MCPSEELGARAHRREDDEVPFLRVDPSTRAHRLLDEDRRAAALLDDLRERRRLRWLRWLWRSLLDETRGQIRAPWPGVRHDRKTSFGRALLKRGRSAMNADRDHLLLAEPGLELFDVE